jgi:hypothetical protein
MSNAKFFIGDDLEPLTVTVAQAQRLTGESRTTIYDHIGNGRYTALKSGARVLITYESIKRRIASLPRARIKASRHKRVPKSE